MGGVLSHVFREREKYPCFIRETSEGWRDEGKNTCRGKKREVGIKTSETADNFPPSYWLLKSCDHVFSLWWVSVFDKHRNKGMQVKMYHH